MCTVLLYDTLHSVSASICRVAANAWILCSVFGCLESNCSKTRSLNGVKLVLHDTCRLHYSTWQMLTCHMYRDVNFVIRVYALLPCLISFVLWCLCIFNHRLLVYYNFTSFVILMVLEIVNVVIESRTAVSIVDMMNRFSLPTNPPPSWPHIATTASCVKTVFRVTVVSTESYII